MWVDAYELAPAPREASLPLKLQVLFSAGGQSGAWPVFLVSSLIVWGIAFIGGIHPADELKMLFGGATRARGTITQSGAINLEINEQTVYAFEFEFADANGERHTATSYAQASPSQAGTPVEIEYLSSDPSVARILDRRLSALPFPVFAGLACVPGIALLVIVFGLRKGWGHLALLTHGTLTTATLLEKEATGTQINEQAVMRLSFSFLDQNERTQRHEVKTHHTAALLDDDQERLLYDPRDPQHAVLLDHLDGDGEVTAAGGWRHRGDALQGLKAPIAAVALNAAVALLHAFA